MDTLFRTLRQNHCIKTAFVQYYFLRGIPGELPRMIRELEGRVRFMETRSNHHTIAEILTAEENLRFLKMVRDYMSFRG